MTEEQIAAAVDRPEPEHTGVARVDAVIDRVSELTDRPVDEHLAVFEAAHDELRRSLDAPPDDTE